MIAFISLFIPPLIFVYVREKISNKSSGLYHNVIISLIPCAITLVFAITAVWNKFGKEVSIVLMTMAGLSVNAVRFNVEVRMYSWD